MKFTQLKNMILDWCENGLGEYWLREYKDKDNSYNKLYEKIDLYFDKETDWVFEDIGYEIEDCNIYIEECECAIKRYPNNENFKVYLEDFKHLKNEYLDKYNTLYKKYVRKWKVEHKGKEFKGMKPACFDEWYNNEAKMIELKEEK